MSNWIASEITVVEGKLKAKKERREKQIQFQQGFLKVPIKNTKVKGISHIERLNGEVDNLHMRCQLIKKIFEIYSAVFKDDSAFEEYLTIKYGSSILSEYTLSELQEVEGYLCPVPVNSTAI